MKQAWRERLLWAELTILVIAQLLAVSAAFARAPVVTAGQTFTCTPTRVWDGDGPIWCREGPRLRLRNLATREIDGSCRHGQPCPIASGLVARDRLVALLGGAHGRTADGHVLVRGPALACRSFGPDRYNRTVAACADGRGDLATRLIAAGVALPWHWRD